MRTLFLFLLLLTFQQSFAQLQQISSFGTNPGNLNMYLYAPSNMPASAPVVVAMHGCTQSASQFATETGWNTLANQHKFYVIYPEQLSSNNSSKCFNWFESGDITKGQGECRSIKSMIDYVAANYSIDASRVFVTGFSAGGGMTTVMLATYPEVFKGGAVMAGLPYKAGIGTTAAFSAMSPGVNKTPQEWGNLVRGQNTSYTGPWPTVAVFHGTSDFTVKNMNLTEVMEQWTNVHGTDATVDVTQSSFNGNSNITRKDYHNGSGTPVVVTYDINSMGHVVAIDPGTGAAQGGTTGSYSSDVNFYSGYWAGSFWNLFSSPPSSIAAPTNLSASSNSSSSINLIWTDNANNEQNYQVERSLNSSSGFSVVATLGANSSSYTDNGLTASTTYYYRVQATSGSSSSAYSNTANATTSAGAGTAPNAPSALVMQSRTTSSISLSWTDNSSNEDNFELQRSLSAGTGFSTIATLAANTTAYADNGLSANTTYYYRVRATNVNGASTYSNELSVSTLANSTTTIIQQNTQQAYIAINNFYNSGQSFTATVTGILSKIDVNLRQAVSNSTLRIYSGNTVSGTALYQQTGINLGSGWQSITLSNSFNLSTNQQYTFVLTGSAFGYALSNVYSGGNLWYNGFSYSLYDAAFRVYQESSGSAMQVELASVQKSPDFQVFPNPSRGKFNISSVENLTFPIPLRLFDAAGRLIKTELMQGSTQEIDCNLSKGLYWLVIGREKVMPVMVE